MEDCRSALAPFDRALKLQPGNYQAGYLGGACRFLTDDFAGAIQRLEPFWEQEKENLEYLFMLGVAYGTLKRETEEARAFDQLIRAGGDSAHLHLLLGKAYLDLYNEPKAREELEKAVAADPKPGLHARRPQRRRFARTATNRQTRFARQFGHFHRAHAYR